MSDRTFIYRALIGLCVLLIMGVAEWWRTKRTTRLREYAFLFGVAFVAVLYALVHDALTFHISYDYFALGKGLMHPSYWPDVAWLAAQAGWSAGLVLALALLVANNPSPHRAQLTYRQLLGCIRGPLVGAPLAAVAGFAIACEYGAALEDLLDVARFGSNEPEGFLRVWCMHIGSYVGAALGGLYAVVRVRVLRPT